jgi:hypothetical protein
LKLVHVRDFHATILHLMGMDHERLTYHHAGRDFRLTDIHENVVHFILTRSLTPPDEPRYTATS